jgi:hypothetical protein
MGRGHAKASPALDALDIPAETFMFGPRVDRRWGWTP